MIESGPASPETQFANLRESLARPIPDVAERIADGDSMFIGNERHYRKAGQSAWRCIASALVAAGAQSPRRVLDLPCGHGRVLRVLEKALPHASITACDLDRDGVDFCASEFGATPVYSNEDLTQLSFDEPFDLIWCGSLVTHLDQEGWLKTFQLFLRSLQPGGLAVITFHGRWVAYRMKHGTDYGLETAQVDKILNDYEATGFGYADYDRGRGYGVSLAAPSWILREIAPWPELRVVSLSERQWDEHQDVLAVQRIS